MQIDIQKLITRLQAARLCPDKIVCDLILEMQLAEFGVTQTIGVVDLKQLQVAQDRLAELEARKDELPTSGA